MAGDDGATFVVLVRGINVGGKAKLAMAELRSLLTSLGYTSVRTLLQSGNVVLDAPAGTAEPELERRVEAAITERFGLTASCLARSTAEFRTAVASNPLAEQAVEGKKMMVFFLSEDPDPVLLATHDPVQLDPERIVRVGRLIYQWCPDGVLAAPAVGPFVERRLKVRATARNWNTLEKLAALADE